MINLIHVQGYRRTGEHAAYLVDHQTRQSVAVHILGHDPRRPVGLTQAQLGRAVSEACKDDPIIETQGRAGDVMLVHPFVLHTVSTNIGKKIRVICNPHICFKERMNVTGEAGKPVSPVERAIVEALSGAGVE